MIGFFFRINKARHLFWMPRLFCLARAVMGRMLGSFNASMGENVPGEVAARVGGRATTAIWLEGHQDIEQLLPIARLLDVGDLAAPTVGNAGFGDLGRFDGVGSVDILRPHDTGDD